MKDFQLCRNCFTKCHPLGSSIEPPNKRGNMNRETYIKHDSNLCGKCQRLRFTCMDLPDHENNQTELKKQYLNQHGHQETQLLDYIDIDHLEINKSKHKKKKNNTNSNNNNNSSYHKNDNINDYKNNNSNNHKNGNDNDHSTNYDENFINNDGHENKYDNMESRMKKLSL